MDRPTKGRRSVARMLGTAFAIGLYMTVLVAATQITGADAAAAAAPAQDGVAAMSVASQAAKAAPAAQPRSLGDGTESPLMTLAIAGVAIAAGGGYRLASVARRRRPAPIPVRGRRVSITT